MSLMDRLDAILDDADQLLAQADDQTVDEALARGEAPDHLAVDDSCPWCHHGFHGLPCAPAPTFTAARPEDFWGEIDTYSEHLTAPDPDWDCRCDSARTRPDDTWRPYVFDPAEEAQLQVMDETGMDGWAARIELTHRRRAAYEQSLRDRQEAHDRRRRDVRNRQICRHMNETGLDGWAAIAELDRSRATFVDALGQARQAFAQIGQAFGATFDALATSSASLFIAPAGTPPPTGSTALPLADWERVLVGEPEPETPMARALRLRLTRNTGPERPTAERSRRPRRHGH